jgi:hypothetical protein
MNINLNTCKPGDKLTTENDRTGIYIGLNPNDTSDYRHLVHLLDGTLSLRTYTDRGVYAYNSSNNSLNIIKIGYADQPDVVTLAGFKTPTVMPRREDSRGPEYGYYECDPLPRHDLDGRDRCLVMRYDSTNTLLWGASVLGECLQAFMSDQS